MTTPTPEAGVPEPAPFAEVQATDALLERLSRRVSRPGDLDDPVFAALSDLVVDVEDDEAQSAAAVAHMLDVLQHGPDPDAHEDEDPASRTAVADVPAAGRASRVIDLTEEPADEVPAEEPADAGRPGAPPTTPLPGRDIGTIAARDAERETGDRAGRDQRPADGAERGHDDWMAAGTASQTSAWTEGVVTPMRQSRLGGLAKLPNPRHAPRFTGEERWERALRQLSMPVAAAVAVFALGSGVTAALTGDPMKPLDSVGRVVDHLSGNDQTVSYNVLKQDIQKAKVALRNGDEETARELLATVERNLGDVEGSEATLLKEEIAAVEEEIPATGPGTAPGHKSPSGGVVPSQEATRTPVNPTTQPSSAPTTEPSKSSAPTQEPSPSTTTTPPPTTPDTGATPLATGDSS